LGAGTYYVTVTDSSGCFSAMDSVVIDDPGNMVLSTTITDVLCHGLSTGSAAVTVNSGGAPPSPIHGTLLPFKPLRQLLI
jgi:hypothetical protein